MNGRQHAVKVPVFPRYAHDDVNAPLPISNSAARNLPPIKADVRQNVYILPLSAAQSKYLHPILPSTAAEDQEIGRI